MTLLFENNPELAKAFQLALDNGRTGLCIRQGRGWWLREDDPMPADPINCWSLDSRPSVYEFLKKHYPEALI